MTRKHIVDVDPPDVASADALVREAFSRTDAIKLGRWIARRSSDYSRSRKRAPLPLDHPNSLEIVKYGPRFHGTRAAEVELSCSLGRNYGDIVDLVRWWREDVEQFDSPCTIFDSGCRDQTFPQPFGQ